MEDEAQAPPGDMYVYTSALISLDFELTVKVNGGVPFLGLREMSVHCKFT